MVDFCGFDRVAVIYNGLDFMWPKYSNDPNCEPSLKITSQSHTLLPLIFNNENSDNIVRPTYDIITKILLNYDPLCLTFHENPKKDKNIYISTTNL